MWYRATTHAAVELLAASGAARDATTKDGKTAVKIAGAQSHPDVAACLLAASH